MVRQPFRHGVCIDVPLVYQNASGRRVSGRCVCGVGAVWGYSQESVADVRERVRIRVASTEDGPYRLRSASDTAWNTHSGYGQRETFGQKIATAFAAVLRMILPVFGLLACFAGLYLYRDTPVPAFLAGTGAPWLTTAHLLLPLGFFCVHLTNRRFGPTFAFAQVVVTSALIAGVILFAGNAISPYVPQDSVPPMREAMGFGGAFFIAAFISIVVFDGTRGAHWWTAPLFGLLVAAIFFALIFVPAAYAGADLRWFDHGLKYMGLLAGEGLLLLIPYYVLRRMVPPISGLGGY